MAAEHHRVMISGTFVELEGHWEAVSRAVLAESMFPIDMRNDSALPDMDLIDASLAKVEQADAYVGMISYRYGQTPVCPRRNPETLSLTELEYRRAVERNIPRCIFIMHKRHPDVSWEDAQAESAEAIGKRIAFTERVRKDRVAAEFKSVSDLEAKAAKSLSAVRRLLDAGSIGSKADLLARPLPNDPAPPALLAKPPYLPGYAFEGRVKELTAITDWARSADPILLFEAIGGMGKSMVTWHWITTQAPEEDNPWAGVLWYSFYELGADMRDFCVTAMRYITGRPPRDFEGRPTRRLAEELLPLLRAKRWLLVLDGLERVLVEYHRSDAAQVPDENVAYRIDSANRVSNACIRAEDDDLLRQLPSISPSKALISSRLIPRILLSPAGVSVPGVRRYSLKGLDPRDAERLLRQAGIRGDSGRMQTYLEQTFGGHPLIVGVVAGLIRKHMVAPNDFDHWVGDPEGGAAIDLTDPDIRQRQNHILKAAFDALDPQMHELMARIAICSNAVDWETLDALNPARPPPPQNARHISGLGYPQSALSLKPRREEADYQRALGHWRQSPEFRAARPKLVAMLNELETRGLLQCDRETGKFDIHPVVRGYAVQALSPEKRTETGQSVADYYSSRPSTPVETARNISDLSNAIQVVRALNIAGKLDQAWSRLLTDLSSKLLGLECYHELLSLIQPMFANGWQCAPSSVRTIAELSNVAGNAMDKIGLQDEAIIQFEFAIEQAIDSFDFAGIATYLVNYSAVLRERSPCEAEQAIKLAVEAGELAHDYGRSALWSGLNLVRSLSDRGALSEARAHLNKLSAQVAEMPWMPDLLSQALWTEVRLDYFEGRLNEHKLGAALDKAREYNIRWIERRIQLQLGEWYQSCGQDVEAVDVFEACIEMARSVGLRDQVAEVRRSISLARIGRNQEAAPPPVGIESEAPLDALAELFLALGDSEQAKAHALRGYRFYWCAGPPYSRHWQLQQCRSVLQALGEPEPDLPPFDATKVDPLEFETAVRELIASHKAGRG